MYQAFIMLPDIWSQSSMHRLLIEITRPVTNRITRAGNEVHIAF